MPIIQRPNRDVLWSESGNQTEPSTEKQELGWVIEKPPYEEMNWIHYQQDLGQKYLLQRGWAEWYAEEDYPISGCVQYNGKYYKAILENKGKQPDISPEVWKIAFSDYQLTLDIKNILEVDNYADKLVYKDAPIFRAKAIGTGYEASVGNIFGFGYTFTGKAADGLFHTGQDPVILKDSIEVARFAPINSINESNKKVVTMDALQRALENVIRYKVGDLYLTTNNENPNTILGYGTWVRFAEGRTLVGISDSSSSNPEWTKYNGGQFGEYSVKLTQENLPPHKHYAISSVAATGDLRAEQTFTSAHRTQSDYNGYIGGGNNNAADTGNTSSVGGDKEHNNVQPSTVVSIWRRTA